jgi:hypothetical protein
MSELKKTLRFCKSGHKYYKSSDCPTCPVCEKERKPEDGFLSKLSAPARRALVNKKILTIKKLSEFTETEILNLHGIGPSSIPLLKNELKSNKLSFRKSK